MTKFRATRTLEQKELKPKLVPSKELFLVSSCGKSHKIVKPVQNSGLFSRASHHIQVHTHYRGCYNSDENSGPGEGVSDMNKQPQIACITKKDVLIMYDAGYS